MEASGTEALLIFFNTSCEDSEARIHAPEEIEEREIQVDISNSGFVEFRLGDETNFALNMHDLWVKKVYKCSDCESLMDQRYEGWKTVENNIITYHLDSSDCPNGAPEFSEYSHPVFINFKNGRISDVISEEDFHERDLTDFLDFS